MAQFALLLPRGQREKGIRNLVEIAEKGDDSRLWAEISLLNVYLGDSNFGQQYLETAERLHNLFADNSVIQLELGNSYRQMERWVLAEAVYRSIVAKVESRLPGYDEVIYETSRLRMVECQINLGKMDEAYEELRLILVSNPINPEWVVPWAHFYTAQVYLYRKEPRRAERALNYALDGKDYDNLHEIAKREMNRVKKMKEDLEKSG
jgi:tetratricopeptide (TPR) repeat protein